MSEPQDAEKPRDAPRVVVCDDGELDDFVALLARLDEHPLRMRPARVEELREEERPTRLFVTSAHVALAHPLRGLLESRRGPVSIAVADGKAHTLCTAMLRRGFRYVVRRPVHEEALRLLLVQVLFTGEDVRLVARFPFGAQVHWRRGLRSGECTMTEISAHGCRLLGPESFPLDSRLHLRVPAALAGRRDLRLRGRVVRRDLLPTKEGPRAQLALRFARLSARTLAHLDALLAECASGPASLAEGMASPPSRPRRLGQQLSRALTQPGLGAPPSPLPEVDRRRHPRSPWRNEVVALEGETQGRLHVLLGTDLSTGGLRVEPHPLLRVGHRFELALYDPLRAEPLRVRARVAREDGRRGFGLVFEQPSQEVTERIAAMLGERPLVSTLSEKHEPESVVVGEIVTLGQEARRE